MMNLIRKTALAFTLGCVVSAAPALAVTTTTTGVPQGAGTVTSTAPGQTVDYTFSWTDTPVTAFVEFVAANKFSLSLLDYDDGKSGGSAVTGYILERVGGLRETTLTTNCSAAGAPFSGNLCNLIADGDAAGGPGIVKDAIAPVLLFSDLAAGSWRLGIYDSADPKIATASFRVSEVPAPMGALLLASAFGVWRLSSRPKAA